MADKDEVDIFVPSLNLGIEYDGERWHSNDLKINADKEKGIRVIKKGLFLIRIREPNCPELSDGSIVITTPNPSADWMYLGKAVEDLLTVINNHFRTSIAIDVNIQRDLPEAIALFKNVAVKNSIAVIAPHLAEEWDYEKNKPLRPENIPAHSGLIAWWICSSCGNKWSAEVASRMSGKGCPKCGRVKSNKAKYKRVKAIEIGQEFNSVKEAAIFLGNENYCHNIANCAKGRKKTAYGYSWVYVD